VVDRIQEEAMELKLTEGLSLAALIVSLMTLLVNYFSGRSRDILAMRPVLVFEYQEAGWNVHNIGGGPALDVVFTRFNGNTVHDNVRLPALAKDGSFAILFASHDNVHEFAATYRDIEGRPYTSRSARDVSVTSRGFKVPRSREEGLVPWWSLRDSDL
jgi:hypothetical protein